MRILFRKFSGVSLFEVLLVLVVASLMAVGAMRYAKQQQEIAADQLYGQNLYSFGQAVQQYVTDAKLSNSNIYLPGTDPSNGRNLAYKATPRPFTIIQNVDSQGRGTTSIGVTGVDWLKAVNAGKNEHGQPYLPDNFSFAANMSPLLIAFPDNAGNADPTFQGDAAIKTGIYIDGLDNVTITVAGGVLYEQPTKVGGKPKLMPALTQQALVHANTMYTPTQGLAVVNYSLPYIDATGAIKPNAVVSGTTSTAGDPYLRTDGTNQMEGDINFDPSLATAQMNDVSAINFVKGSTSTTSINDLDELRLSTEVDSNGNVIDVLGKISGVNTMYLGPNNNSGDYPKLVFADTSNNTKFGGGIISGVTSVDFAPFTGQGASTQADPNISGLKNLTFNPNGMTPAYYTTKPGALCLQRKITRGFFQIPNPDYPCNCSSFIYRAQHPTYCLYNPATTTGAVSQISGINRVIFTDESNGAVTRTFKGTRIAATYQQGTPQAAASVFNDGPTYIIASTPGTYCFVTAFKLPGFGGECSAYVTSGNWYAEAHTVNYCQINCLKWD